MARYITVSISSGVTLITFPRILRIYRPIPASSSPSCREARGVHDASTFPGCLPRSPLPTGCQNRNVEHLHDRTLRREVIDVPFVESSVARCVGHAHLVVPPSTLESLKRFDTASERETDISGATRANPPPTPSSSSHRVRICARACVCRSVVIIAVASHKRDASGRVHICAS